MTLFLGYLERPYLVDAYLAEFAAESSGWQATGAITIEQASGWQANAVAAGASGWQATAVLYNIDQLRILDQFPSRGDPSATGLNAWGNTAGVGDNWAASTTAASSTNSFTVRNVNTDIVEQRWQGANGDVVGVRLKCDTEKPQGVFLDTFAMLDTNLTSSAFVQLIGSNMDDFSVSGVVIQLEVDDNGNVVYVSPDLPNAGWKYWAIDVDDFTNPDGYLRVGTIVFGAAVILTENFVDQVQLDPVNYTDEVFTEAFTNAQNDRGVKQMVRLDFRNLRHTSGNFQRLKAVFNRARTTLKCLWIPTPRFPARYMVFGKLRKIPSERHNVKSEVGDYIAITCEVDESK